VQQLERRDVRHGVDAGIVGPGEPRKGDVPVGLVRGHVFAEHAGESGVEALDQALRLGVIRLTVTILDAQSAKKSRHVFVGEMGAVVRNHNVGTSKVAHDAVDEARGSGGSIGGGNGNGLDPLAEVVHDDQNVTIAAGGEGQRAHVVHDDDVERARGGDGL